MRTESLAQRKAKTVHWIRTYQSRIEKLRKESSDKRKSVKTELRIRLMKEKIYQWTRSIKTMEEQELTKVPAVKILQFAEKYFTKDQFQLHYMTRKSRVAAICFSKYCCENQLSNKEMWAVIGVHENTFAARRNCYTPSQMGDFYRRFKKYMDDCISKEREIRKNRKSTAAKRGPRKNKSAQEIGKTVRSSILQHESEILH